MRKYLLGVILIFGLISCSSNNNNSNDVQPSLINIWSLETWKYNNNNQSLTSCDKQGYIKFNSNGTFERKD